MARPIKQGLDYCSLDTDIFGERKIRRLLKTFGPKGFTIFICLLCEIYKDKGYYIQWDDELAFDVSDNIPGATEQLVKEVVSFCIECGIFDKTVFSVRTILTSQGIQKRYKKAKDGGKLVIDKTIWVIDPETTINDPKTPIKGSISTQRKEKENKGKEIKEKGSAPLNLSEGLEDAEKKSPPVAPPPSISTGPTIEMVKQFFRKAGGTDQMAEKFWNKYEGVGWKQGYSPIVNWSAFANNFIANYWENEKKNGGKQTIGDSINAVNAATIELIREVNEAAGNGGAD